MSGKQIPITCKGSRTVPISSLFNFQGNLKTLNRSEADKLRRSILKHGFSFPAMVWGDKLLDGHQRLFVVRQMLKEGYTIDEIPVVDIQARTEAEAAEKLLLINSHYAKITDEGLYEFLNNYTVDISQLAGDLELPGVDIERFLDGYISDGKNGADTDQNESKESGTLSDNEFDENKIKMPLILNLSQDDYVRWNNVKQFFNAKSDQSAFVKTLEKAGF